MELTSTTQPLFKLEYTRYIICIIKIIKVYARILGGEERGLPPHKSVARHHNLPQKISFSAPMASDTRAET